MTTDHHHEPTGYVLTCPRHDHTLGQVIAHAGTGWPHTPDALDAGVCVILPALDRPLTVLAASHADAPPVPLTDLPHLLRVPPATVHALVADGLPVTAAGDAYQVALTELAAWTHTARGGPGRQPSVWVWRCWPCLRAGRPYPASTGGLPVSWLTRLAAARMLWTPGLSTVPATRDALAQATRALTPAGQETLDAATAYLAARCELRTDPPPAELAAALAWHPSTHPDAPTRPPTPASQAVRPATRH